MTLCPQQKCIFIIGYKAFDQCETDLVGNCVTVCAELQFLTSPICCQLNAAIVSSSACQNLLLFSIRQFTAVRIASKYCEIFIIRCATRPTPSRIQQYQNVIVAKNFTWNLYRDISHWTTDIRIKMQFISYFENTCERRRHSLRSCRVKALSDLARARVSTQVDARRRNKSSTILNVWSLNWARRHNKNYFLRASRRVCASCQPIVFGLIDR